MRGKSTWVMGVAGGLISLGWLAFGLYFIWWMGSGFTLVDIFQRSKNSPEPYAWISAYYILVFLSGIIGIAGGVVSFGRPLTRASAGFFAVAGAFGVVAVLLVVVFVGVEQTHAHVQNDDLVSRLGPLLVAIPPLLSSAFFYMGMRRALGISPGFG